ncbi:MAG: hypothetical protein J5507_02550 [Clostridia bacterium]|nr:hypothetical protein [Clostridia bacterium]
MSIFSQNLIINYSDVDSDNELTNKGILRLMQEVAGVHSGTLGYGVNDVPKTHLAWLILNWKLKIFSRPKTNTPITVRTWVRSENPLFCYRDFEILDNYDNLIAVASSKWILFDVNKKRITKLPIDVRKKYSYEDKFAFKEDWNEKLNEPENSNFVMNYKVKRRDIDTNKHVNNLYYLDYAIEALPEEIYNSFKFSNVEIMYKHEAKLGDTISLFYSNLENNEYVITIKDKENNKLHAIVKLYN